MRTASRYFHNGRIHINPNSTQIAEALYVRDGHVRAFGSANEVESAVGSEAIPVDLGGRTVIPGLIDAHIHLEKYARWLNMVDCEQPTVASCLELVSLQASSSPRQAWIHGHGWNQNTWGAFGNLDELDAATPNHPAYLTAKSLHAAWVNSHALQISGIDNSTPDPPDGTIQRDEKGKATGILLEGAMRLVSDHIPVATAEQLADEILVAQNKLARFGLTGIHDFDGPACLRALQIVRERGELQLRVLKNIPVSKLASARDLGLRSGFGDAWIRIGNIKVFADGALGPRTAAMLQPYEGEPENRGMLLLDSEALVEIFEDAANSGFGMTVHAIGDSANHEVFDAYALLRKFEKERELPHRRHRIEHLQVLHPDDLPRASELDVVASMQPIHATSDMEMADRYWGDRTAQAYAWRTQLELGSRLAFGSDAPVETPNPILGLAAAVTRRRDDGLPGVDGWVPDQRIEIGEALAAYTTGAAYAAGTESWQGRLDLGFVADLVVLDRDPFEVVSDQISDLTVLGTMVGGNWSYRSF
jgi:predicted amidohydrolase YtcJ